MLCTDVLGTHSADSVIAVMTQDAFDMKYEKEPARKPAQNSALYDNNQASRTCHQEEAWNSAQQTSTHAVALQITNTMTESY